MPQPNPLDSPELEFKALLWLVLAATLLFALILWPFFGAVCWAVFITIVFWPLQRRFVRGSHGRPGMASAATMTVILLIVILPVGLITAAIAQEASMFIGKMRSGEIQVGTYFQRALEALPAWLRAALDRFGLSDLGDIQERILSMLGDSGHALTSRAFSIGHFTLEFALGFFVMMYLLYFLFRDGERITGEISAASPLREEHTQRLLTQFAVVVRATVKGSIVVAVVQGVLGGLAFLVLGIAGPLLWGAVMALFSLLPAVGTFMVWGPVAAYLFFTGSVLKALGLVIWGVLVIGLVDNFLRPMLVGRDTRIPDYLVLVATLGGLVVFGLNGFVIGPVIAAIFLVSWELLADARQQRVVPSEGQDTM